MASTRKSEDGLDILWTAHADEIKEISDEGILDGVDMPKFRTDRIQMMASVRAEADRRRLVAVKSKLDAGSITPFESTSAVSADIARAFLREASNNPRYTMAARGLDAWSDELVLKTYARIKAQEARDSEDGKT